MEKYISKCLDSLLIPSINLLDILVINDGSKDRSSEVAHEYEKRFPNSIRVIDKENGHYGSCVNRGLKEAKGKYVKILDSDDFFLTSNFQEFVSWIKNIDTDLVLSAYEIRNIDNSHKRIIKLSQFKTSEIIQLDEFNCIQISTYLQMHGFAFKRTLFTDLNYKQTEGCAYTDQEWIFSPMTKVKNFAYFDKPVYCYLIGREDQSMSINNNINSLKTKIGLIFRRLKFFEENKDKVSQINKNYLAARLQNSINGIYSFYLRYIRYPKVQDGMRDFDEILKSQYPDFYVRAGEVRITPLSLKIVRDWRSHNYRLPLKYFFLKK